MRAEPRSSRLVADPLVPRHSSQAGSFLCAQSRPTGHVSERTQTEAPLGEDQAWQKLDEPAPKIGVAAEAAEHERQPHECEIVERQARERAFIHSLPLNGAATSEPVREPLLLPAQVGERPADAL